MKTIGLAGIDTWHTNAYTRIFNGTSDTPPVIEETRITHVWAGNNPQKLPEAEAKFGAYENVVKDYRDLIGLVDGVIVSDVDRGGAGHAGMARPFIEAGIPVFIDKPMTLEYTDAVALFDLADEHDAAVMSCSALRYPVELDRDALTALGHLSAVVSVGPGDWFNYGIHAVEAVCTIAASNPRTVHRTTSEDKDIATVTFDDGLVATVMVLRDAGYQFHVTAYGENGHYAFPIDDADGFYANTMREFAKMVETKQMPLTREQTLAVLQILHAGNLSAAEGRVVDIAEVTGEAR